MFYTAGMLKDRIHEAVEGNLPTVTDVKQLLQIPTMLLYILHYKDSNCIFIAFSLCER
jgi:hypothetical protein